MLKCSIVTLGLIVSVGTLASCASDGDKSAKPAASAEKLETAAPLTLEETAQGTLTAKIKAINYSTRVVTLEDAAGHTNTFVAGPQVQRLDDAKVGDTVTVNFVVSLLAELRPPTPQEKAVPVSTIEITGRSPTSADPAHGVIQATKVVTTVEAIDLGKMLVTLKGPLGETTIVRARKTENIKKLHVGDTIVITYAEGVAASLTKKPK